MRITLFTVCCIVLFVEATLWVFLRPVIAKIMFGLLALSAGAGFGVALGINPAGPAVIGFLVGFLLVPGRPFARARDRRVDWWRRKFADFPEPWKGYANLVLDAPSPL